MLMEDFARRVPMGFRAALVAYLRGLVCRKGGYRRVVDHFRVLPQESFLWLGHSLSAPEMQKLIARRWRLRRLGGLMLALHGLGLLERFDLALECLRRFVGLGRLRGGIFARDVGAHADRGFGLFAVDFNC
jgi:hypothetical protein